MEDRHGIFAVVSDDGRKILLRGWVIGRELFERRAVGIGSRRPHALGSQGLEHLESDGLSLENQSAHRSPGKIRHFFNDRSTRADAGSEMLNVDPFVVQLGKDYVVCSEMVDEEGNTITADYVVRKIDGEYRVVQMLLNDRESLQAAMSKLPK